MKRIFYILLNLLLFVPGVVFASDCVSQLGTGVYNDLQYAYNAIRLATPVLVLILCAKDILTAVTAGKEDEMKKAQSAMIKRIIIGVVIFFIPTLIDLILYMTGINSCPIWK